MIGAVTALLADPIYKQHVTGPGHPERPERVDAILGALEHAGLMGQLLRISPRAATEEAIQVARKKKIKIPMPGR